MRTIKHNYETTWTTDEEKHWYKCSICGDIKSKSRHVYSNDCDTNCNICGAVRMVTHQYGTELVTDENQHWYECFVCGRIKDKQDHTYDNTCDTTCSECGMIREVSHIYSINWVFDESQHWHECLICQNPTEHTTHTMDQWKVIKVAGYSTEGLKQRKCITCEFKEEQEIRKNVLEHISLTQTTAKMQVGDTLSLSVYCEPTLPLVGEIVWYSSDEQIAQIGIETPGTVTAVGVGKAIITVAVKGSDKKATCVIEVTSGTPTEQFVTRLYQVCLNRDPDAMGKADWSGRLQRGEISGVQAAYGFIFSDEFKGKNLCNDDYVEQLYNAFMGRGSDPVGKTGWVAQLNSGSTREAIFNGFAFSPEFQQLCTDYGIRLGEGIGVPTYGTVPTGCCSICGKEDGVTGFVKRLYNICLGREADAVGLADWTNKLWNYTASGSGTAYGFIFSNEFISKNYSNEDYVEYLYNAFMGRGSDPIGKAGWVNQLNSGSSRYDVFNGFVGSQEFMGICNSYGILRN